MKRFATERRPDTEIQKGGPWSFGPSDEAMGGIEFRLHSDVERISAEVGYWVGEPFWGKGIVAEALRAVTRLAVEGHGLRCVFAVPYASNPASFRVLEKLLLDWGWAEEMWCF